MCVERKEDNPKREKERDHAVSLPSTTMTDLYRGYHSAESKDSGTVLHSRLVIKRSLCVHYQHSNLNRAKVLVKNHSVLL